MSKTMAYKEQFRAKCKQEGTCMGVPSAAAQPCVDGKAGTYACCGIDLLSHISVVDLGSKGEGNDIWGWTDASTGKEYAIVCLTDGTSFVDVSNPTAPRVLAWLPTHTVASIWRDVKVYKDHAFIVSEARNHGMQIFDLTQLRSLEVPPLFFTNGTVNPAAKPVIVKETAWYGLFGSSHNIVINEDTGFAYSVGTKTCAGGLHIVNIQNPLAPVCAGCYFQDGYTHDAQCVVYHGPDTRYTGKEICFCYNEDSLTIVDVTVKTSPVMLSRKPYLNVFYTHQGWTDPTQRFLLLDDELDELEGPNPHTRTLLWDISSLTNPVLKTQYFAKEQAIDHNLYIKGNLAYLANYCAGLNILDTTLGHDGVLKRTGFFDVSPECNTVEFMGSWSSYPYFASNSIIVSSIERGLFTLKRNTDMSCS